MQLEHSTMWELDTVLASRRAMQIEADPASREMSEADLLAGFKTIARVKPLEGVA